MYIHTWCAYNTLKHIMIWYNIIFIAPPVGELTSPEPLPREAPRQASRGGFTTALLMIVIIIIIIIIIVLSWICIYIYICIYMCICIERKREIHYISIMRIHIYIYVMSVWLSAPRLRRSGFKNVESPPAPRRATWLRRGAANPENEVRPTISGTRKWRFVKRRLSNGSRMHTSKYVCENLAQIWTASTPVAQTCSKNIQP